MRGSIWILFLLPVILAAPSLDHKSLLEGVLEEVKREVAFFSGDYSDINVDGLFGMRLGQGQIIKAIEECQQNPDCPDSLLQTIKSIESNITDTCDKALPYVEQADPDYYKRFEETIDKPYLLPYQAIKFDKKTLSEISIGTNSNYDEEKGDACYSRIMGNFEENNRLVPKCNITNSCWDMMTDDTTYKYSITHQLLYFIVIEKVGCTESVEDFLKTKKIRDIQTQLCRKIYKESESLVSAGSVQHSQHDLFLEQIVLCSSLGYEDFLCSDWMAMTLRWPDKKDGCFKMSLKQEETVAVAEVDEIAKVLNFSNSEKQKDEQQAVQTVIKDYNKEMAAENPPRYTQTTMRKLLREKSMKDGCLSHTTGLGFGVFCDYMRYLIKYM